MGESVASRNALQVSASFGKFENDSLSWEKWSSFSPNKYLEEVGSLSTPGSVAQKRAYFEAHYKKIAAQKAELLELEKLSETYPSISDINQNISDHTNKVSGTIDAECGSVCSGQSSVKEVDIDTNLNNVESSIKNSVDELKENDSMPLKCQSLLMEEAKEELTAKPDSHAFDNPEEIALVKDETPFVTDETLLKESQNIENVEGGNTQKSKEENVKLDAQNLCQKITSTKKEQNSTEPKKKKPVSLLPKSPHTSAPRLSKPTVTSASWSSVEKASVSALSRSKNVSVRESKQVAPTSLHTSLNLDSTNSDPPSLTTTRRSLFMEKMGDKDIVKRAFKTFQNNFNQLRSSTDEKSSERKQTQPLGQVAIKGSERKVSTSMTFRKENERMRNVGDKMNAQRGRLGTTWKSVSLGSLKEAGLDGRKLNVSSSSIGFRSEERAEKQKELLNKVEEKSYAKETEKTRLSSKLKEEKESESNRLRQSLNFKAKPMPDFYRGLGVSKNPTERVFLDL
ncbi:hypothetical protein LguiA_000299 [Lonicera macranthoides]